MSNFTCNECNTTLIDCGKDGYKTPKEIALEEKLEHEKGLKNIYYKRCISLKKRISEKTEEMVLKQNAEEEKAQKAQKLLEEAYEAIENLDTRRINLEQVLKDTREIIIRQKCDCCLKQIKQIDEVLSNDEQ